MKGVRGGLLKAGSRRMDVKVQRRDVNTLPFQEIPSLLFVSTLERKSMSVKCDTSQSGIGMDLFRRIIWLIN